MSKVIMQLDNNQALERMAADQKHLYIEACVEDLMYQLHDFSLSYDQTMILLEKVKAELEKEYLD